MGKLLTALRRLPRRTSALVAIIAAAVIVPAALFAWGPDRPTFTEQNPAPYVTFNSITNNSFYGDERNFTTIKDAANTSDGGWKDTVTAEPGKEYVVRMYVHNNAADNLHLVATNTRASASVPTTTGKNIPISGFVTSDNANPGKIWDDVNLVSDRDFNLAYVPGSATYHNNSVGKAPAGTKLSDSIVTSAGALLGYDALDGKIPGCYQYSGYVYFKIKPQFAPTNNFEMTKQVRKAGETAWTENVSVKAGDTVEYQISYKNTGETTQRNVVVKDILPTGLTYVDGSSYLKNGSNPNGVKINDDVTKPIGINITNYTPQATAYVKFSAKVNTANSLTTTTTTCGTDILINKAQVIVDGGYKEDTANVTVPKVCEPQVKYTCDALTVTKIDRTHFKFATAYTVENATFKNVTYVIRAENGTEIARTTDANYTQPAVGKYTVEAIVTVTVNGQDKTATSANCKKPFEVTDIPVTPVYTCDSLVATKITRTNFSFTGKATADGGATIVNYVFNFGDGTTQTVNNPNDVKHTYAKAGTYTAKLSVTVKVNGSEKTITDDTKCIAKVIVSPEECKPGIPMGDKLCTEECKPGIPANDDRCKETPCVPTPANYNCGTPPELPKTGAGDGLAALIGAGSLIAAVGYYIASRRNLIG